MHLYTRTDTVFQLSSWLCIPPLRLMCVLVCVCVCAVYSCGLPVSLYCPAFVKRVQNRERQGQIMLTSALAKKPKNNAFHKYLYLFSDFIFIYSTGVRHGLCVCVCVSPCVCVCLCVHECIYPPTCLCFFL